jgi:photosystem II stability/assembly factor-like uncharacterized protein
VLIDPHDSAVVYNLAPTNKGFVTRSTDGGSQWSSAYTGIDRNEFPISDQYNQDAYNAFALDEGRPSRLVLGGQSVWQTLDRGSRWKQISGVLSPTGGSGGGPASITAVAIAPSRGETIYAATQDGRFFATFDGGTNWLERNPRFPLASGNETLVIVIDPANPNRVFIQMAPSKGGQPGGQIVPMGDLTHGRIWMTNNGGSVWTKLDARIPPNLAVMSSGGRLAVSRSHAVCGHDARCLFLDRSGNELGAVRTRPAQHCRAWASAPA